MVMSRATTDAAFERLVAATRRIYSPANTASGPAETASDMAKDANYLKKNRVLYHVLKKNEKAVLASGNAALQASLHAGDEHFFRLNRSLSELNTLCGRDSYFTIKTYLGYERLTTDLDIVVKDLRACARALADAGWHCGPIQQGTMDLEKDGALAIGLHEKVGWDTPPIFEPDLLWKNLREIQFVGETFYIPSPEVDILTILAHIPFEKLYLDWGEMCYLYKTAQVADLDFLMKQVREHHWRHSFEILLSVMNLCHEMAYGTPSPFEKVYPKKVQSITELPYECSFWYGGSSLIEIGAWKKIFGVVFDPVRMSHFFRGRAQRKKIKV